MTTSTKKGTGDELGRLRSHIAALEQLIEVQDQAVLTQSERLEGVLQELEGRAEDLARSEKALEEEQHVLMSILDSMSDGVVVADENGRFLQFNPAAEEIIGRGMEDVAPPQWSQRYRLFMPDKLTPYPTDRLPLVRAIRGESADEVILWVRRAEGAGSWVSINARPLRDKDGVARGGVVAFRDVTESVLAKEAIDRSRAQLARSNAELEQFAYVVSHDLQEPLRVIKSYAELLDKRQGKKLPDSSRQLLSRITGASDRLSTMIRDLLTLSRVSPRGSRGRSVDCNRIVKEAVANLQALVESENAEISCGTLPRVTGDPTELTQLFQNLIANAIKFHGDRAPRVAISCQPNGEMARFSVADEGIGISPDQKDEIFGMFKRLHSRERYPGTGIGLALCKKIVERHGGRIWVESRPREGATFLFTIPLEPKE